MKPERTRRKSEPKRILKILAPVLLEKNKQLQQQSKERICGKTETPFKPKDIMLFAKEPRLQNFFSQNGFDGGVYKLPNNFWGGYLAVVNANIAGGKSDFFVNQEIDFRINLENDGKANNQLKLTRAHSGNAEKRLLVAGRQSKFY